MSKLILELWLKVNVALPSKYHIHLILWSTQVNIRAKCGEILPMCSKNTAYMNRKDRGTKKIMYDYNTSMGRLAFLMQIMEPKK